MSGSFGGTVKLTGESEYRKALRDITSNLKLVSSELKLTNAQFMSGDNTLKQTKSSYKSMQTTLEEQKTKVNDLRKALKDAENEYGANSVEVKKLKTGLNNAEVQLKQMEDATDKNNKELKDMKDNLNNAGQGALKFGDILKANVIGDVITSGLRAVGNGIKQLGSALVNVGKQAVNSYADYEQLIGGIETLFKESTGIVENYANNAYKTAGLSANKYMETATSFSASLLQSLNGDTAKTAEVIDMAIVDMSDNVNKIGTSMESVQNAYQGFAKQNYTMLDNLKLGYGGTKTEMERLLVDATKISGIKYDISSLNDVFQAIHVIQGELGITGTTAKEASTTIQGSVSSMKSAWQNLLTGIADDNADFGQLISNFVDSVLTASNNLLPRIKTALGGIGNLIVGLSNELLPKVLEIGVDIINNLLQGIQSDLPNILNTINNVITTIVTSLISMLPQILEMGMQLIVSLVQGISQQLPTLIPQMVDAIITMVETLLDNIDLIIDAGIDLIIGLTEGLIEGIPKLIEKLPEIIEKIVEALIRNGPKIVEAGKKFNELLIEGILSTLSSIGDVLNQLWEFIVDINTEAFNNMWNGIVSFFTEGIPNFIQSVVQWFEELPEKIGNVTGNIIGYFIKFGVDAWNWVTVELPQIIQGIVDWFKELPGKIWTWLLETVVKVTIWGADMAQKGKDSAKNLFDNVINTIRELPQKMLDFGKNIVEGLWNGIQNATQWIKDKVASFARGILDGMKNALGIHSPSTLFRDQVGKFMAQGIGLGFENEMGNVTRQMQDAIPTKFDVETTDNLSYSAFKSNSESKIDILIGLLDEFLPQIAISNNRNMVLDTGELVGATANMFDTALGNIQIRGKRGN